MICNRIRQLLLLWNVPLQLPLHLGLQIVPYRFYPVEYNNQSVLRRMAYSYLILSESKPPFCHMICNVPYFHFPYFSTFLSFQYGSSLPSSIATKVSNSTIRQFGNQRYEDFPIRPCYLLCASSETLPAHYILLQAETSYYFSSVLHI